MDSDFEDTFADEIEDLRPKRNDCEVPTIDPRENLFEEEDDFSQEL